MISRNSIESAKAIKLCNYECVVCGYKKRKPNGNPLVVGAHVRAFENAPEYDVYNNIIALCPNCHAEYDSFIFYIDPKSRCLNYLDSSNPLNGKNIGDKIKYVDSKFLAFNVYLYKKNNGL